MYEYYSSTKFSSTGTTPKFETETAVLPAINIYDLVIYLVLI